MISRNAACSSAARGIGFTFAIRSSFAAGQKAQKFTAK
jgi:hypothetical protein